MNALRAAFPRIFEFLAGVVKTNPRRAYFQDFAESIAENPVKCQHFRDIEADLSGLDDLAWAHLKTEVAGKFRLKDPKRGWQSAFDILNEAKAYHYMVRLGCRDVAFLPASLTMTPDLRARLGMTPVLCEVKTIKAWEGKDRLPDVFFKKLAARLADAEKQMASFREDAGARRITYVVLDFGDHLDAPVADYVEQVRGFATALPPSATEIVFDVKLQLFVCSKERAWQAL